MIILFLYIYFFVKKNKHIRLPRPSLYIIVVFEGKLYCDEYNNYNYRIKVKKTCNPHII